MTTNELINLLKNADPDGNSHIVIDGLMPVHIMRVPGYYDGNYSYIENNKWITTNKNDKVKIQTIEKEDFIENKIDGEKSIDEFLEKNVLIDTSIDDDTRKKYHNQWSNAWYNMLGDF